MYRISLYFVLILTACSAAPLTISLGEYQSGVTLVQDGAVYFQKSSQNQVPPTAFKSVTLEGQAVYQQAVVVMEFYASDGLPCNTQNSGVYRCAVDTATMDLLGQSDFSGSDTQAINWSGTRLTNGVNKGNLYIGVRLKSGLITSGTLKFRNMVAKVALF